jgi:hypothetical protein
MPTSALAPFIGRQGLGISVSRGLVYANSALYLVNDTFVPCVAHSLNWIYLTLSPSVAIAVNQSGFPGLNCLPIAIAQAYQTEVHMQDYRPEWYLAGGSGGGGGGGGGNGVVASVTAVGQSGSIPSANLLTSPVAGMYALYADILVTTAGGSGTLVVNAQWNNGTTTASLQSASIDLTVQGETAALLGNFYSTVGQPITWSTTATGNSGTEQYQVTLRLVYLG